MYLTPLILMTSLTCTLDLDDAKRVTVREIEKVECVFPKKQPNSLIIEAVGKVSSLGYELPKLIPKEYEKPPKDGVQVFTMTVLPPSGFSAQVISSTKAELFWKDYAKQAPWVKGIRVNDSKIIWLRDVKTKDVEIPKSKGIKS